MVNPNGQQSIDAERVAGAVCGDGAAFELAMRDTSRLLFRTTCSILKGDAEAKDAGSGTPISTRGVCCERSVARVPARTHADGFAAGGG